MASITAGLVSDFKWLLTTNLALWCTSYTHSFNLGQENMNTACCFNFMAASRQNLTLSKKNTFYSVALTTKFLHFSFVWQNLHHACLSLHLKLENRVYISSGSKRI